MYIYIYIYTHTVTYVYICIGKTVKTVKDVSADKFIVAFSQHLKRQGRFELPKWADYYILLLLVVVVVLLSIFTMP